MKENAAIFSINAMSRMLHVSRSGYFDWLKRGLSKRDHENKILVLHIQKTHEANRKIYGYRRVHSELKAKHISCGPNRVARLMRCHGIRPKTVKKFKVTTDSKHCYPIKENILSRDFNQTSPDRVWVGDITYIPTQEGWLFLAIILDLYSRRVIGWAMGSRMTSELVKNALMMAVNNRGIPSCPLIWHSDRGSQYASFEFQMLLKNYQMQGSMSRKGNCWDNAVAESFFHTLKVELVHHERYSTREEAQMSIFDYIETFYNRKRRHSTLGYLSPVEFESMMTAA